MTIRAFLLTSAFAIASYGQSCVSIAASYDGGWKPAKTAPRDGTVVEMIETYGVAPWYGIFKWTKEMEVPVVTIKRQWQTHHAKHDAGDDG